MCSENLRLADCRATLKSWRRTRERDNFHARKQERKVERIWHDWKIQTGKLQTFHVVFLHGRVRHITIIVIGTLSRHDRQTNRTLICWKTFCVYTFFLLVTSCSVWMRETRQSDRNSIRILLSVYINSRAHMFDLSAENLYNASRANLQSHSLFSHSHLTCWILKQIEFQDPSTDTTTITSRSALFLPLERFV